jgi:SAM-dependent methyltransferase
MPPSHPPPLTLQPSASSNPFQGARVLDVGCGGGILCDVKNIPKFLIQKRFARLGANVVGVDATPECIASARRALDGRFGERLALVQGDVGEGGGVKLTAERRWVVSLTLWWRAKCWSTSRTPPTSSDSAPAASRFDFDFDFDRSCQDMCYQFFFFLETSLLVILQHRYKYTVLQRYSIVPIAVALIRGGGGELFAATSMWVFRPHVKMLSKMKKNILVHFLLR